MPLPDDPVEAIVQLAIQDADQRDAERGAFYPLFDRNDSQLKEGGSYLLSTYFDRLPPHFQKLLAPLKSNSTIFFSPVLIPTDGGGTMPVVHVYSIAGVGAWRAMPLPPIREGSLLLPPGGSYPVGVVMDPRVEQVVFTPLAPADEETPHFAGTVGQVSDPFGQIALGVLPEAPLFPFVQDGVVIPKATQKTIKGTPQDIVEDFYRGAPSVSKSRWGWSSGDEVRVDGASPLDSSSPDWLAAGAMAVPGGRGTLGALRTGGRFLWRGAGRLVRSAPVRFLTRVGMIDLAASVGSWAIMEIRWDKDAGSQLMLYAHNRMVDEEFGPDWAVNLVLGVGMAASDSAGQVYANSLRWRSESLVTENRRFVEGVDGFLKDEFEKMIADSRGESGRVDLVEVTTTDGKDTVVFAVDADLDELKRRLFNFYNGKVDKGVNPGLVEQRYEELDYTGFRLPHGKLLKECVDEKGKVSDPVKFRNYLSALFQEELDKARGEQARQMVDVGLGEMRDGKFHSLLPTIVAEVKRGQRQLTGDQKAFLQRERAIIKDSLTWRVKFLEGITEKLNNF